MLVAGVSMQRTEPKTYHRFSPAKRLLLRVRPLLKNLFNRDWSGQHRQPTVLIGRVHHNSAVMLVQPNAMLPIRRLSLLWSPIKTIRFMPYGNTGLAELR